MVSSLRCSGRIKLPALAPAVLADDVPTLDHERDTTTVVVTIRRTGQTEDDLHHRLAIEIGFRRETTSAFHSDMMRS